MFAPQPVEYLPRWLRAQLPPAPVFEITRITGNLYRGNASGLCNVFLVTPGGIILADPIQGVRRTSLLNIEAAYNNLRLYR